MSHKKFINNLIFFTLLLSIKQIFTNRTAFYWNGFSEFCNKTDKIPFENYSIITNINQSFRGEKIVIFYDNDVGLYPHLKNESNGTISYFNGGLPQKANMTEHEKKLKEKIKKYITNESYDGLAIIDVEEWRPTYDTNWSSKRIYRNESIKLVNQTNSTLNQTELEKKAKEEFDKAAFNFLNKTLEICKQMRPNATWGYYGFPICNENAGNRNWSFCFPKDDDTLIPFLVYSDALFPSPYIVKGQNYTIKNLFVNESLNETKRMVEKMKNDNQTTKKVYVYQKFEVDPFNKNISDIEFFDPYLLCISYQKVVEYGFDGLIIWSPSRNMTDRCSYIKNYTETLFGPYIQSLQNNTQRNVTWNKCEDLLNYENITKWCETNFYGPNCLQRKLNLTGITTTATPTSI